MLSRLKELFGFVENSVFVFSCTIPDWYLKFHITVVGLLVRLPSGFLPFAMYAAWFFSALFCYV